MPELLYRKQDENGDMLIGQGEGVFITGQEAMEQSIKTRLRNFYGEWWEEDPGALPMMAEMLGLPRTEENKDQITLMIADRIADTKGVLGVDEARGEWSGKRGLTFTANVRTIYGAVTVDMDIM